MLIAILVSAYLLGSVPFGLLIVKNFCGIDIRSVGSGNIGATNVLRAAGPKLAAVVFAMDVVKGLIPTLAAKQLFPGEAWIIVATGMVAIMGHTLSIFLRFKGGKGVATGLGVIIGLDPRIAGIGFGIWLLIVAITKYVSLASIIAAVSITTMMRLFHQHIAYQIVVTFVAAFVIFKHRSNMVRLIQGKEPHIGQKVES